MHNSETILKRQSLNNDSTKLSQTLKKKIRDQNWAVTDASNFTQPGIVFSTQRPPVSSTYNMKEERKLVQSNWLHSIMDAFLELR